MFLREAVPLFIMSAPGLFPAERIGLLVFVEDLAAPVVGGAGIYGLKI